MGRINTNVSSLIAQRAFQKNSDSLNTSLQRLSTGLRINTGADDPAGLIASQNLDAEKTGLNTAIGNAQRADNVIGTADGGLSEVSSLLNELEGLVGQSANSGGLSADEISANQLQVDSILNTVNRIAGSTSFEGKQLLNGNLAYSTSGAATSAFDSLQVNSAILADGKTTSVVVQVTNSATTGKVDYTAGSTNHIGSAVTLTIAGNAGTEQLSFASGTAISAVAAGINAISNITGVSASANGTSHDLSFVSTGYGSSQFVSVTADKTYFTVAGGTSGKSTGKDAAVTINGAVAETDGKNVTYRTNSLDVELDLSTALNGGQSKTFGITGGGATFALGSKVNESNKASIGIADVSTGSLGNAALGYIADLASGKTKSLTSGNLGDAQKIVDKAITQVSQLRGRLGAFEKFTIGSTVDSLSVAYENASSAASAIEDTDFASETANLTRAQILSQAATTVLSQANSAPQNVLSLLGR